MFGVKLRPHLVNCTILPLVNIRIYSTTVHVHFGSNPCAVSSAFSRHIRLIVFRCFYDTKAGTTGLNNAYSGEFIIVVVSLLFFNATLFLCAWTHDMIITGRCQVIFGVKRWSASSTLRNECHCCCNVTLFFFSRVRYSGGHGV